MNLSELRAKLKQLHADATAIIKTADEKTEGVLSEEQQKEFDASQVEFKKVKGQIDRLEKLESMGAGLEETGGRAVPPAQPQIQVHEPVRSGGETAGFSDMADFGLAVMNACRQGGGAVDERLAAMSAVLGAPTNFHKESGSDEGYMVPPAFRNEIWDLVFNGEDVLNDVDPEPTNSNSVEVIRDESTPWGSTGIQASWESEGNQFSASKLATKAEQLKLHKLYAFVLATEELRSDAPRLAGRLTKGASDAIRYKASEAIVTGDGVGKPLGWMDSGALVSVARETSQAANTIVAKNVAKMFSRQLHPGRSNWYVNQDTLPEFMTMVLGNQPIWTPPKDGFAGAPGGFLFGRPIKFTEHNETLGTKGDIQFVDPNGYYAIQKETGINFASSIHLYFDYDIEAFRWTFRLGGQPFLSAPVSPAKGTATKSHFVTLDTRA